MDPVLKAVLLSWGWRLDVILVLVVVGTIFSRGWWQLRQKPAGKRLAVWWRLVSYLSGLVVLGVALMSPVDTLGSYLFSMHMIQHLLLIMIVPVLLLIANPLPFFLWGLPAPVGRRKVGQLLLAKNSTFRRILHKATPRGVVWLMFVGIFLGWHAPIAYNAALSNEFVHDLEHISFFISSVLFWWHVIGVGPNIHKQASPFLRAVYVLAVIPPNLIAGATITFADYPIYTYYTTMPRLWGFSVMRDQMLGGEIMWIPGSMMFIVAVAALVVRMLHDEENAARVERKLRVSKEKSGHAML